MAIHCVALIFDDSVRSDTTGVHVLGALRDLVEVVHYRPGQKDTIPASGFDLYLSIDDDTDHDLPASLGPLAYWAIDTHLDFDARLGRSRRADLVFSAQRDGAERLAAEGIESPVWLPLACNPDVHRKQLGVAKEFDFSFVGNLFPGERADAVALLRSRYPTHFVGNAYGDEMSRIYSASRLVLNRSIRGDVNMRVFEALACGSLLLTDDLATNGLTELFRDGEHLATYRGSDELFAKAAMFLEHEDERERIAAAGRAEVLARHTYRHRMERLLEVAEDRLRRRPRPDSGTHGMRSSISRDLEADPRAKGAQTPGLASIIVPCFDQLEFTRHCLRALFRHTKAPWELIVVDNGSGDGTAAYLGGVQDVAPAPVTVVTNATNIGFPAAINQGLRVAKGEYVVLLNNDAVVTEGWLEQLIALTAVANARDGGKPSQDSTVGMTGPMSNYASPPQLVEGVPYRDLAEMHEFAGRWRDEHRGQWLEAGKLAGFCLLIKRVVIEAIGGLDERFGLGFFDDDDLAERARRAGFSLAVARDLFVHHFGSRTFVGAGIDAEKLLDDNARKFAEKWGRDGVQGRRISLSPWNGGGSIGTRRPAGHRGVPSNGSTSAPEDGGIADRPQAAIRTARVSLTMIVRDEQANLPACLESVRGLFDEIVVVDTGSEDRTREIAREYGASVCEFAWVDDFAAARNEALGAATGDYAFWLDADDVVEPTERARILSLLSGLRADDPAAYVVRCACDPDPEGGGETVVDHIRLFPLRDDVRWTYRVHEQILPALRRAGVPVRWTEVTVRHTGYSDPALRARKLVRDERILLEDLASRPDDPFVLFNLGSIAVERKDWRTALEHLRHSLTGSAPTDSITRKLFALIARCHQMLNDLPAALAVCTEGLSFDPDDAELLFRKAIVHRQLGQEQHAEADWKRILSIRRPEQFSSVDQGIYGHLTRRNLASLAEQRGDLGEAAEQWRAVLSECPYDVEAAWGVHRLAGPVGPQHIRWLFPESIRQTVPACGLGDFDPYHKLAADWVISLDAKVVVELGVRLGSSTRALLAAVHRTGGELWGVDLADIHGISDPRFHFLHADAEAVANRWNHIDLLHVDTDPHTEEQTLHWFTLYAGRCRAIALHDTHHPAFGVGSAVRSFLAESGGGWTVHEYWGNPSGWVVLTREVLRETSGRPD